VRVNFFSDMADGRTRERRDSKHAGREDYYYNSRYENDSYVPRRRRCRYEYEGQEEQRGFVDKYSRDPVQARTGGKRCTQLLLVDFDRRHDHHHI
jgi:hypothetical protein